MQVREINSETTAEKSIEIDKPTSEELQREYDFYIAEKIAKRMREECLISDEECTRISAENRRIFSPLLAELS